MTQFKWFILGMLATVLMGQASNMPVQSCFEGGAGCYDAILNSVSIARGLDSKRKDHAIQTDSNGYVICSEEKPR